MTLKPLAPLCLCASALVISILGACQSSQPKETTVTKINRMSVADMEQLSHVGNVWISEQPTEKDLRWMRDNYVSLVIDTRSREEERGFDERAYVVSLGMKYRLEPLEPEQAFTIGYFDRIRGTLQSRQHIPTLIHGETADRAAAAWMPYRVLDQNVPYPQALAEARTAGLTNEDTLKVVQQYLKSNGVNINEQVQINVTADQGPDETIFHISEEDDSKKDVETKGQSSVRE